MRSPPQGLKRIVAVWFWHWHAEAAHEATRMPAVPTALSAVIGAAVADVRAQIATACARVGRDPLGVRLIAVTKNQAPEVLSA